MVVMLRLSSRSQPPCLQPRKDGTYYFTKVGHVGVLYVVTLTKLLVVLVH